MGIFELELRPGKQLFPLNYNNIINDKNIKYNIKAIKLIVRETYGGVRTYINQIMFYEQSAEEVKDLLCSNELNKIYKLNNKKNNFKKNLNLKQDNKSIEKNNYNNYNSEQIVKRNKIQVIKNNSSKKINKKNKNFEEKEEESDIYNESYYKNINISKKIKLNNSINNSKIKNEQKMIKITPIAKKPNRQIKTDLKKDDKNNKNEKLHLIFNENKKNDNLTPNKYLQRIKNLNQGNKTTNINNHIQFPKKIENKMFNTSFNNNNDNNDENNNMDFDNDIQDSFNSENNLENNYINGQNNLLSPYQEYVEENNNNSNTNDIKKVMSKTHENLNYNNNNYKINNNVNNSSLLLTEGQNINYINNNNNYSQRNSILTINDNYNNTLRKQKNNQIKQKLDYLEGNILEIKKNLQDISEGFAFCISQNYIQNFKDEILLICEEIYNEYYPNYNNSNYKNGNENDSLMSNSNYISQIEEKDLENQINKKLDEKLDSLQNNIFDKYIKPNINKIGNSMKKNMEQIQYEVDNMDKNGENINDITKEKENDLSYKLSTSKIRNEKFEEINKIGERLYNKLLEKEKKLKILKQEKAKFLDEEEDNE